MIHASFKPLFFLIVLLTICVSSLAQSASPIKSLKLEKTTLILQCPPGNKARHGACPNNLTTKVKIVLTDPKKFEKRLNYEISGGKINGKGTSITWEMTGVKPGTYTITANVTSKKGKSIASATKTITVMECDDCGGDCFDCSHVVVEDPKTVSAGQLMIFNAIFRNGPFESTRLNWKVSDGVIVEGQGTPTIKVATSGLAGKSITATLEIEGECPDCLKTVTGSGSVKP